MAARFPLRRTFVQAACLLPLGLAPLLGGTTGRPYTMAVAALCGVAGLAAALGSREQERPLVASWFAVGLLTAFLLSLLQLVPLPPVLRALLAPGSDLRLRQILAALGAYPARPHALSLDPPATANEAARLLGYLCLLLGLGHSFGRRGEGTKLGRWLCLAPLLVAFLGGLGALGVPLPPPLGLGAAAEGMSRARLSAGFLNSNHLAAFLLIGATLTAQQVLESTGAQRLGWALGLLLLDIALLGTLSRAGIAVGLCAQLVTALWPRRGVATLGRRLASVGVMVLVLAVVAAALVDEAHRELQARFAAVGPQDLHAAGSRVRAWAEALPLIRGHLPLGVGRGAFDEAFQQVSSLSASLRFVYLENEWLQAVVDFGVPGTLLLGVLLVLGLRDGAERLRSDAQRGRSGRVAAFVALCAVLCHNLVDFNLEAGGVAVLVVGLCALCGRPRFTVPRPVLVGLSLGVVLLAALCQGLAPSYEEEGQRLRALAEHQGTDVAAVLRYGEEAVRRHPFDSYLSAVLAARLWQERRPEAIEWVNRALLQNPNDVLALRTAALALAARGYRSQAAATLRHALLRADYSQRLSLYRVALLISRSPHDLPPALPPTAKVAEEVLTLLEAEEAPRWPYVKEVATWAAPFSAAGSAYWLALAALGEKDVDAAARQAQRLLQGDPPVLLLTGISDLLLRTGRKEEAERLCRQALRTKPHAEFAVALARALLERGARAEARQVLEDALRLTGEPGLLGSIHEARADLEEQEGNLHRARQERLLAQELRQREQVFR